MHGAPVIVATPHRLVDVTAVEQEVAVISWWEDLTSRGGEGMVVKPLPFITKGLRGLS